MKETLTKKYRVVTLGDVIVASGEFSLGSITSVGQGNVGEDFDTEQEMLDYIAENNYISGEDMLKSNTQIPIRGKRGNERRVRGLVSGSIMIADKLIAITVENKYLVPYLPDSDIDANIQGLIQYAQMTGTQSVQYSGEDLNGTTTYLLNIDNLTPEVFAQLQLLSPKIYLEWLENHNLKSDGVEFDSNDWDEIASMTNLTWDKYSI